MLAKPTVVFVCALITDNSINTHAKSNSMSPLPNADMLLDIIFVALIYSALDLALEYHQLRINPDDTHKISFKIQFDQFEWLVLPFGPAYPSSFYQRLMSQIIKPMQKIHSSLPRPHSNFLYYTLDDHIRHLDITLSLLASHDIRLRLPKKAFYSQRCRIPRTYGL
jgi:hypothetical protein